MGEGFVYPFWWDWTVWGFSWVNEFARLVHGCYLYVIAGVEG